MRGWEAYKIFSFVAPTGKEQNITITGSGTLSSDEVDQMIKDAESHREADQARREEVESRKQ